MLRAGPARRRIGLAAPVVAAMVLAGCTHPGSGGRVLPGSSPARSPSASSVRTVGVAALPATPTGRAVRWVLQTAAGGGRPTVAQVGRHVSKTFLASVPVGALVASLAHAHLPATIRMNGITSTSPQEMEASVLRPSGRRVVVALATNSSGVITELSIRPAPPMSTATSPAGLQRAAAALGVHATVLSATVGPNGTCVDMHGFGNLGAHPLGSMFKLYVLGAVVRQVQAGALHWTTRLTVTPTIKSLPTGQLQNAPAGTTVSVLRAATLMISISDNTAADMLIAAVGSTALATAVRAMGDTHPALLDPFLTTKQVFTLDYDAPSARAEWAAAGDGEVDVHTGTISPPPPTAVATRGGILEHLPGATPTVTTSTSGPGWADGIEWYATPADICRAQAALHRMAATPAGQPVAAILSKNPGVPIGTRWTYAAFKGGGDTGALTGSWLLQPPHGAPRVLVIQVDTGEPARIPDDFWFAGALSTVIQHLAL